MVTNQSADFEIFLGGPNVMPSILISRRGTQTTGKQRERSMRGTWMYVASFEDGRIGLEAKGCRWPLKAGNSEKIDDSSAPPERNASDYSLMQP